MTEILLLLSFYLNSQTQLITKDFDWRIKETKHFDIYHYPGCEKWLGYLEKILEEAYEKGKKDYNPLLDKRIPFFFFTASKYFQQNSINEVGEGTGGFTEPFKDRFLVYSDGSKRWLRYVIHHEFGHEIQFSILVDGGWETPKIIKTFVYPLWMLEGLSENMTDEWDIAVEDMYVRDYFVDGKLPPLEKLFGFSHLKPHQMTLAYKTGAKAIRFLKEEYGYDKAGLMLYYWQDSYDINTVFKKLIGSDLKEFDEKFRDYLSLRFYDQMKEKEMIEASYYGERLSHDIDDIPVFNTSPIVLKNGSIAYISTVKGYPSVVIEDRINDKKIILDRQITSLDWILYSNFTVPKRYLSASADGVYIIFSGRKSHRDYMCIYNTLTGEFRKTEIKNVDEISQINFSPDGKKIVFAAMKDSFYNIYEADFEKILMSDVFDINDAVKITDDEDYESSPYYLADGKIAFICEEEKDEDIKNSICVMDGGRKKKIFDGIDVVDFYYDIKKDLFYIISDHNSNFELYSYNPSNAELFRHTSVIGGIFTPYSDESGIYFSYFRHGSMHIYKADEGKLNYIRLSLEKCCSQYKSSSYSSSDKKSYKYKTKFSTDLFLPTLFFSSPGGLFLFNYWQLSDYTSRHSFGFYSNYNSASSYSDLRLTYLYNRYRTKFFSSAVYLNYKKDTNTPAYKRRFELSSSGFIYPFDLNSQLYILFTTENDFKTYIESSCTYCGYRDKKRGLSISFSRNLLNGLYLTAVEGYAIKSSISSYGSRFGGNISYSQFELDYLRYIPLSRKSTNVNRFYCGFSWGKDYPLYSYSGAGGVRGIMSSRAKAKNILIYNSELRFPIGYSDYYMSYIFPDLYFKSFYIKFFADNSYAYEGSFSQGIFTNSLGFGFDVYTFVLQTFKLVFSLDFARNIKNGSDIAYFYLGPLF
ncbi:MAG: hypothetical protein ACP5IO_07030 [Elusimicrobiales bacterium]